MGLSRQVFKREQESDGNTLAESDECGVGRGLPEEVCAPQSGRLLNVNAGALEPGSPECEP